MGDDTIIERLAANAGVCLTICKYRKWRCSCDALLRIRILRKYFVTGEKVCAYWQQVGKSAAAKQLCQDITSRTVSAGWAWKLAGRLHLKDKQFVEVPTNLWMKLQWSTRDDGTHILHLLLMLIYRHPEPTGEIFLPRTYNQAF